MGKHGPRPEPLAVRIAKGTEKKRPRPDEPTPPVGEMVMPEWLGPIAQAKWAECVATMRDWNTLSPGYVDLLALYCQAHQDMHDAMEIIEEKGKFVHSEKGGVYQHPAVGMYGKAIDRISKLGREFGFSPTSVRDIHQTKPADKPTGKKRFFGA